jgi:UDP-N-acetylglucosamine 4,6-dehydratase
MIYANAKWLITGGTGSFASHAIPYILEKYDPSEIVVYSRDEYKQYEMRKTEDERVTFEIGDVRDKARLDRAMKGVRYVIHSAALKHVHTAERDPREAIKTNVAGTANVVDAANRVGARMVLLSTDKACEPINAYGATKMLAERITLDGNQSVVRYGNVIGSRGSVFDVFRKMADYGVFKLTDRRCTRFGVTFEYAIELAIHALTGEYPTAEMLVSKANAFYVEDLAYAFAEDAVITERGLSPGEKIHETLMTAYEAYRAVDIGWYYSLPPDAGGSPRGLKPYTSEHAPKLYSSELRELIEAP